MKKNILFFGDHRIKNNELLLETYNVIRLNELDDISVDLIITNGEKCKSIRETNLRNIPIIFLLKDKNDFETMKSCFHYDFNINDYILTDHGDDVILEKIENIMLLKNIKEEKLKLKRAQNILIKTIKELNESNKKLFLKTKYLEEELNLDVTSNVYTKRYMFQHLDEEIARSRRHDRNFAIVLVEIKNLDEINEDYGHFAGDEILKKISNLIIESVRNSDVVGKIRGKVYMVLLPEIIEKYTISVIERMLGKIENIKIKNAKVESCAGFFLLDRERLKDYDNSKAILAIMDKLLYFAKESNQKIVEYEGEKMEAINKIKEIIPDEELYEKHNLIWEELNKSQKFIEKLLPKEKEWKQYINYNYIYYPFNFIGGDFFDFYNIDEDRVAILFCDVSGHGVSSALYITAIKYIFKDIIQDNPNLSADAFLDKFNKNIIEISEGNIFVATFFGVLDKKNNIFLYSFGGGTSPMKISKSDKGIEHLSEEGFAIGLTEDAFFERNEIKLEKGDILFFYSDGIYEFLIEKRIISDIKEFYEIVEESISDDPQKLLSNIYKIMQSKTSEKVDFDDDITMLAIRND